MEQQDKHHLIPIGKLKGEIDETFEAFYVARDKEDNLFINREPEFGKPWSTRTKGWEPITQQQLEDYKSKLHFLPHKTRRLKL